MSRPLRILYPDAWYHLMNRGRRHEEIYEDRGDYLTFIELLREASEMYNVCVTAYCLMPNHYHLLIQTPDGNLSSFMRQVNAVYTQRFNKKHDYDGPLFRGRYKSILIDQDSYLLELVRYIHRNPFESGLETNFGHYPWSSHNGFISNAKKWDWLHKDFILSLFSEDKKTGIRLYKDFILKENSEALTEFLGKIRVPPILGGDKFIKWAKESFFEKKYDREVPQSKILAPSVDEIRRTVCKFYDIDEKEILEPKRGKTNEPRKLAIYLSRRLSRERIAVIAKAFNMESYTSVSSVVIRTGSQLQRDSKLQKSYQQIYSILTMRQAKT
ncbi:MAG: transposase [Deltaproteobacteria bacterium]|nr:transposase [Deltaproteobacteria bacterium]